MKPKCSNLTDVEARNNHGRHDKQLHILTGKTLTAYFVIFGSTTFPSLAACETISVAYYIKKQ